MLGSPHGFIRHSGKHDQRHRLFGAWRQGGAAPPLHLGGRLAFTSGLSLAMWRDHVRQASIYAINRYINTFRRVGLSPGLEVAVTGRVPIGAGARTVDLTLRANVFYHLPDAGLTLRLDLQLHADWRVGLMLSQWVVNTSVLYNHGIKAVPQGILLGTGIRAPGLGLTG